MAEYIQGAGYAFEAINVLAIAVQKFRDAPEVSEEIVSRVLHIEGIVVSIKNAVVKMENGEQSLKSRLPEREYEQLRGTIIRGVASCEKVLEKMFGIRDEYGQLRPQETVFEQFKVAAHGDRIQRDRDQLISIVDRLGLTFNVANFRLQLEKESGETVGSREQNEDKFHKAWDELENEIQMFGKTSRRPSLQAEPRHYGQPRRGSSKSISSSVSYPDSFVTAHILKRPLEGDQVEFVECLDLGNLSESASNNGIKSRLHNSVSTGDLEDVRQLLAKLGPDAGSKYKSCNRETRLLFAIIEGESKAVKELLECNVGTNLRYMQEGWSLLHVAIRNVETSTTKILLERDLDLLDAKDGNGKTPLHHCAERGDSSDARQQAKVLLSSGANLTSKDSKGRTPLYLAVRNRPDQARHREKMAKLLLAKIEQSGTEIDISSLPDSGAKYDCLRERYETAKTKRKNSKSS